MPRSGPGDEGPVEGVRHRYLPRLANGSRRIPIYLGIPRWTPLSRPSPSTMHAVGDRHDTHRVSGRKPSGVAGRWSGESVADVGEAHYCRAVGVGRLVGYDEAGQADAFRRGHGRAHSNDRLRMADVSGGSVAIGHADTGHAV